MSAEKSPRFEQRFRDVVTRMRLTRVMTVLGWTTLALLVCLTVLTAIDFVFEVAWTFRAWVLGFTVLTAFCTAIIYLIRVLQHWTRSATAARVEHRFQDLGQSIRTSVEFNQVDPESHGISPRLLQALNHDVNDRTQDLRLNEAVATGPMKISVLLLGIISVLLLIACMTRWDWRIASMRTLLSDQPYTTISVEQGDTRVDERTTFTLNADVAGRTDRKVTLLTREIGGESESWDPRPLTKQDETASETRLISYQVEIPKVRTPFEYRVVAGNYASPVHRVDVRYPLAIKKFQIEVTAPSYTGIGTKEISSGSFDAVQGSRAQIWIQLDHTPVKAWIELHPMVTPTGEEPAIEKVDLEIDDTLLTTNLELREDRFYQVFAEATDGTTLRPNRYRIRVHEDRPPRLSFQKPGQLVEVHSLAELFIKLKVSDDYGLRRAGIVFQLNNDPEIVLEDLSYDDIITSSGKPTPQTQTLIEALLPLEYFEMTVKDSISFYAFAEDNRPGEANRNESDLQFIDIRPFRRDYPVPQDGQGLLGMRNEGTNRRGLPALSEMIGRERFVLNRTRQMQRRYDRGKSIDTNALDNLIGVQNETSEFAGFLGDEAQRIEQQFGIPEEGRISELMYAAQQSMLASVDSLANAEYDVAKLQEKDALQYLIDARQRIDMAAAQGGSGGFGAFLSASRRMMSRVRRPRTNQERAREIVRRLKRAAAEQDFIMDKITDLVPPEIPETQDDAEAASEDESQDEEANELASEDDEPSLEEMRRDVEQQQTELVEDVYDIVGMISRLDQVSPLAEQRTQRAVANADGVVGALERGDTALAIASADRSSTTFRVLAENIAGITATEAALRLEIARNLGMLLTDELRQLEQQLTTAQQTADTLDLDRFETAIRAVQLAEPLSRAARGQAEIAKTIEDVLSSILDPQQGIQDPEDQMAKRLREIIEENRLPESSVRLQQVPDLIDSLSWSDASVQAGDLADRFDAVSQRLDAMHREILAPRVEQLRKLEQRLVTSRQRLTTIQTNDQINRWHLRATGILEDIESANVAQSEVELVREAMQSGGWGAEATTSWDWATNANGTLQAPDSYDQTLTALIAEIQRQIRELSIRDSEIKNSGAVPPKYRHFVQRYFDLLSGADDEPDNEEQQQ